MADEKTISEALKLLERTKAQQKKQMDRNKFRKEICDMVEQKALELGKQGAIKDWLSLVLKNAKG